VRRDSALRWTATGAAAGGAAAGTEVDVKAKLPLASKSETEALDRLAEAAAGYPEILRIVVFGSRVRGDFHGESDLDLLVVVGDLKRRDPVIRLIHDLELQYDVPLSPVLYTRDEVEENQRLKSPFVSKIESEGVVIYEAGQER
jgi:predicted nucleotidyltransferase